MTTLAATRLNGAPQRAATRASLPVKALSNVLVLSAIATALIAFVLLYGFDGWTYYRTPRTIRGYVPVHRLLRPSGPIGQGLGLAGLVLMFVPMLYAVRKNWKRLSRFGTMKTWLEVHIFAGIVGPVLVTFHTSFKFNGIVSVAYWMMVLVASSGFIGRYLYVRIPRSLRGTELTLGELQHRAEHLKTELAASGLPDWLLARIDALEARCRPSEVPGAWLVSLAVGDVALQARLWKLSHDLRAAGANPERATVVVALTSERAVLLRRLSLLEKTKKLFDLWHVFHQPLVYFLFAIVLLHVLVVTYMGYTIFSRWLA
jgi:hypothetical protein